MMPPGDSELQVKRWRKASYSDDRDNCVEIGLTSSGQHVGIRDSKDPQAGTLVFTRPEWAAFLKAAKIGEFDRI